LPAKIDEIKDKTKKVGMSVSNVEVSMSNTATKVDKKSSKIVTDVNANTNNEIESVTNILAHISTVLQDIKVKTDIPAFRRILKMNKKAVARNRDKIHQRVRRNIQYNRKHKKLCVSHGQRRRGQVNFPAVL
jgi:hypothetical protein